MEPSTLGELIRAQTQDAPSWSEVDPLVAGALRCGRRTLIRQRIAAGVACCALLITGAAVAVQIPGRSVEVTPAAPTTTVAEPKPTTSASTRPTVSSGVAPTVDELLTLFQAQLSDRFRYSEISDDGEPMAGEVSVAFTLTDPAGKSWAGGGIDSEIDSIACTAAKGCSREPLAGGHVLVMTTPDPSEKAGDGTWYYYQRSDGSWVWFGQNNAFEGNGPVTRATLPLSEKEVFALLTAPEWDPLVSRCAAAGPAC